MHSETMVLIVVAIIAIIAIGVVAAIFRHQANQKRAAAFASTAASRGWQYIGEDNSYAKRWDGPPFPALGGGRVRNVVIGNHRGRDFAAFEFWYTTTQSTGSSTTTQSHHFSVWTIGLPTPVPKFTVGSEGIFGGKVAEALGFARVNIDDEEFNGTFKIKSDDQQFGLRVLHPAVVELLKRTGAWNWRFDGATMLSYEKGVFEAHAALPRLDLMCDVLDRIPSDVWQPSR